MDNLNTTKQFNNQSRNGIKKGSRFHEVVFIPGAFFVPNFEERDMKLFGIITIVIIIITLEAVVLSSIVYCLWNWGIANVFDTQTITINPTKVQ